MPRVSHQVWLQRLFGQVPRALSRDDLAKFQERLVHELETRGLDTISYLPDPTNSDNMVNIVTDHALFSTEYVTTVGPAMREGYDHYDLSNNKAAKAMMLASLNTKLRESLEDFIECTFTFHQVWMELIQIMQHDNTGGFDTIRDLIKTTFSQG